VKSLVNLPSRGDTPIYFSPLFAIPPARGLVSLAKGTNVRQNQGAQGAKKEGTARYPLPIQLSVLSV